MNQIHQKNYPTRTRKVQLKFDEMIAEKIIPANDSVRMNRSIQSEGAFGVIKQDYGFRKFLLRGNKKVLSEILLLGIGYNVNKLHNKIQQNRTGRQLFEKLSA